VLTNQEYLQQYNEKYNSLANKNELWRLKVTQQEFMQQIAALRVYEAQQQQSNYFNAYTVDSNIKGSIAIILMDKLTFEEAMAQSKVNQLLNKEIYRKEAPEVKSKVQQFLTPLSFGNIKYIYAGLFRNQIKLSDLPPNVLEEFKQTAQFKSLLRRKPNLM
jgi:hypothetical protein